MAGTTGRQGSTLMGDGRTVSTSRSGIVRMVDADHAATTRPLSLLWQQMEEVAARYGSVFRGSGPASVWSSALLEESLERILRFVGVPSRSHFALIGRNTTEMLNRLARRMELQACDTVVLSDAEHSSNDLPWRKTAARNFHVASDENGILSPEALTHTIEQVRHRGQRLVVSLTGASNVTGAFQPWRDLTRLAHRFGAIVVIDASQLVAHRAAVDPAWPTEDVPDAIAFAGHKMYAPFGVGVLAIRRDLLLELRSEDIGGGSVDLVTSDDWRESRSLLKRELAGSPNFFGIVATALAGEYLREVVGFPAIRSHEQELLDRLRDGLRGIEGLKVYAPLDWDATWKCALVSFNLLKSPPQRTALRLASEHGVAVRAGHLCQFVLIERLLKSTPEQRVSYQQALLQGRQAPEFGVVRASFGIESTLDDVDRFCAAVRDIAANPEPCAAPIRNDEEQFVPWFTR
jgi:cysteine desulfurase / selenocysteine lyase